VEEAAEPSSEAAKSVLDLFRGAGASDKASKGTFEGLAPDGPTKGLLGGFKGPENPMKGLFDGIRGPDGRGQELSDAAKETLESGREGVQTFLEGLKRRAAETPEEPSTASGFQGLFDKLRGSPEEPVSTGTSNAAPSLENALRGGPEPAADAAGPKFNMPQMPKFERPSLFREGLPENNAPKPSLTPESSPALDLDQLTPPPLPPSFAAPSELPPAAPDSLPTPQVAPSLSEVTERAANSTAPQTGGAPELLEQLKANAAIVPRSASNALDQLKSNADALVARAGAVYNDSVAKVSRTLSPSLPELPPEVQSKVSTVCVHQNCVTRDSCRVCLLCLFSFNGAGQHLLWSSLGQRLPNTGVTAHLCTRYLLIG
jgi:hypothetical protein